MKAMLCDRYGSPDILRILEVEQPLPGTYKYEGRYCYDRQP